MQTKTIDKTAKAKRSATARYVPGSKVASLPDEIASTTAHRNRKKPPTKQLVEECTTKQAALLLLLKRADGTTIPDMMQATGWQQHSIRGFLAATVKKKLGLNLTSTKVDCQLRRYRISKRKGR